MPDVVVVGSINQDIVVQVPAPPGPGETVLADAVSITQGGKGANQAVAAARLGASVSMVGRVGAGAGGAVNGKGTTGEADSAGPALKAGLEAAAVDVANVAETPGVPSGRAFITVTPDGENRIIVAPGANGALTADDVDAAAGVVRSARVVVTQLEIPRPATQRLAAVAAEARVPLILNLAPPAALAPEVLRAVGVLVVNEHEAGYLLGEPVHPAPDPAAAAAAARRLLRTGPAAVALTLGAAGAVWCSRGPGPDTDGHAPAPPVTVVDTTGAGDAFVGALASRLAAGRSLGAATRFAVRVASEATTTRGARLPPGAGRP